MTSLIQLKSVMVQFGGIKALAGVSLDLSAGERLALVGANGSGKSTLLRVMHGLLRPTSGAVVCDSAVRQAMLFQRPRMLRASAVANVALGLWIAGFPWKQARHRALLALERVALADLAMRRACDLSGGQQQRLALARAWVLRPDVLLLDEPTSSLDPQARRDVEALVGEFTNPDMSVVFASHDLAQVKRFASRVIYLERGRVLADVAVQDFFGTSLLAGISATAELLVHSAVE